MPATNRTAFSAILGRIQQQRRKAESKKRDNQHKTSSKMLQSQNLWFDFLRLPLGVLQQVFLEQMIDDSSFVELRCLKVDDVLQS
jgi:hypothetical protein